MMFRLVLRVACWVVVTSGASSAFALALSTTRTLRNLDAVFSALDLEAVAQGKASVSMDQLDYAIKRGDTLQNSVDAADKDSPEVEEMTKRLADIVAFRERLVEQRRAQKAAFEAQNAKDQAFIADSKPYSDALSLFPAASGSRQQAVNINADGLADGLKKLAALDQICKSKYADARYKACDAAARRVELATEFVKAKVLDDGNTWLKYIVDEKTHLEKNNGFLSLSGNIVHNLVYDREKGKSSLLANHKPFFTAAGLAVPADLFAPIDKAVDELWAEVDRLAPSYAFPAKTHGDKKAEAGAKSALADVAKGAKVLKTGMLYADWDIAKNALDIPTEKYRTGGILFKSAESKWCVYREFTAHLEYAGGGKYQSVPKFTFGPPRYQACN